LRRAFRDSIALVGLLGLGCAGADAAAQTAIAPALQARPPGAGSGLVTQQLASFQADAERLRASIADAAQRDRSLQNERESDMSAMTGWVHSINARLTSGTTQGNPDLVAEWQHAEAAVTALDRSMSTLTQLSVAIAQAAALGDYLDNAIQAAGSLQGATDDEHAALLALRQSVDQSTHEVKALTRKVGYEIDQQATKLDEAHRQLTSLRHAIDIGVPLGGGE
jgi:hypothetical protein